MEKDKIEKIKEILEIEEKKSKQIITDYLLNGKWLILRKIKYSESKDKVKK